MLGPLGGALGPLGRASVAPAFSPDQLAGLALWLKADAITGLADGAPVATWPDSSGRGNHGIGTPGSQPSYVASAVNGKPGVAFGSGLYLDCGTDASLDLTAWTLVAVFNRTVDGFGSILDHAVTGTTTENYDMLFTSGDQWFIQYNVGGTFYAINVSTSHRGVWTIRTDKNDGAGNLAIYKDGGLIQAGGGKATPVPSAANTLTVGRYRVGSQGYFAGQIAEIILYGSGLADADRARVEGYLAAKYGL